MKFEEECVCVYGITNNITIHNVYTLNSRSSGFIIRRIIEKHMNKNIWNENNGSTVSVESSNLTHTLVYCSDVTTAIHNRIFTKKYTKRKRKYKIIILLQIDV